MPDTPERVVIRSRLPQDARREQLVDAAIVAIAEHGLSNVTLSKVAGLAGLTAGMVNFHFKSKQELLQATLEKLTEEYRAACEDAVAAAGRAPEDALMGLVEVSFDPRIASLERLAVWYAFWGESRAREDYMQICGASDQAFYDAVHALLAEAAEAAGAGIDIRSAALGLCGLVDALGQEALVRRDRFDRAEAIDTCRRYLANLLPGAFRGRMPPRLVEPPPESEALPQTLPGWAYCSEDFHRAEIERIHRAAWHLMGHMSELPVPGSYLAADMLGERAFVIRTEEGVRAFHNVCRHRAHAVLSGREGTAPAIIRCPYHAWCYGWDGRLKAAAARASLPGLDMAAHGLVPLECEVFMGFVFVRFRPGGPSVAERMAPHAAELAHYRFEDMAPIADFWIGDIEADWKNVWDNYLEDYHFPTGHPGLYGLMSPDYEREADQAGRTIRLSHTLKDRVKGGGGGWAARMYASLLPEREDLPADLRRRWSYFFLYPAVTIEPYPDLVDYLHVEPIGPGRSRIRWRCYALPDSTRAMRAVRWLNLRLNYDVHDQDADLITSVQKGLASSAYRSGVLGEKEAAVRAFQSWIRTDMPEATR